jgi:D-methionine transport system ATP-binding protein
MITVENVSKKYQSMAEDAVNGVSLDIDGNFIYGIIGRSGAGKSTLLRIISLLEEPDSGAVYYNGDRADNLKGRGLIERRRRNSMIFQSFNLFSSRNVFKNISYPMEIVGKSRREITKRVQELLELVELADKAASPISKLSGGQKQRVAIARALANKPEVLFCDEATSALDPSTTLSILRLIKDIKSVMNIAVIMITHQMEVVREVCDRVSVMEGGRIVESGTVKEVFSLPKTETAREFISALKPIEERETLSSIEPTNAVRYRLHFLKNVDKPILTQLIRNYRLDVNILSGSIHNVAGSPVGEIVADFSGQSADIAAAHQWLTERGIIVEAVNV